MKLFIVAGTQELCFRIVNYTSWYRIQTISLPMVRGIDSETKTPRSSIVEPPNRLKLYSQSRSYGKSRLFRTIVKMISLAPGMEIIFFFLIGKRREWRRESKWYREKRNIYELKEKKSVWNRIRIRGHPKNFWKNVFRNKKYKGWNKRERTYKKFIILNNTCNQNYEIFIFYILKSIDQKLLFHHSFFLI